MAASAVSGFAALMLLLLVSACCWRWLRPVLVLAAGALIWPLLQA